jgi:hypothetical protein
MPIPTVRPYTIVFTIQDEKGKTATMSVYAPQFTYDVGEIGLLTEPASDVREYAKELAIVLDAVIEGQIVGISVNTPVDLPVGLIKAAPTNTSDVEEGVAVMYRTAGKDFMRQRIPTAKETFTHQPKGLGVNMSDVAVSAFVQTMVAPEELPANWSVSACDHRGDNLVSVFTAKDQFKRRRRFRRR